MLKRVRTSFAVFERDAALVDELRDKLGISVTDRWAVFGAQPFGKGGRGRARFWFDDLRVELVNHIWQFLIKDLSRLQA